MPEKPDSHVLSITFTILDDFWKTPIIRVEEAETDFRKGDGSYD